MSRYIPRSRAREPRLALYRAAVVIVASALALLATPLRAQRLDSRLITARPLDTTLVTVRKSPVLAGALGFILPGTGHCYAGECGRGVVLAAIYLAVAPIALGGRTDAEGKVAGVIWLAALGACTIDGVLTAQRHNARLAIGVVPGGDGSGGVLKLGIVLSR